MKMKMKESSYRRDREKEMANEIVPVAAKGASIVGITGTSVLCLKIIA